MKKTNYTTITTTDYSITVYVPSITDAEVAKFTSLAEHFGIGETEIDGVKVSIVANDPPMTDGEALTEEEFFADVPMAEGLAD